MIYEAVASEKRSLIFGTYRGSGDGRNDTTEHTIDGITLPPLVEYKNALKKSMRGAILHAANEAVKHDPSSKHNASKMLDGFNKYYDKAFSRFMFDLNARSQLTKNLIPKTNPVSMDDIEYYMNTFGLKQYSKIFKQSKMPMWPRFRDIGPKVSGIYSEQSGTIKNSITGFEYEITSIQYQRLKDIYTDKPELFDNIAYTILYVYYNLGGLGNNGSIPIGTIDSEYIELFGSPLNTQQRYCSPFAFEIDYFGSLGSFFDYKFVPDQKYTCNPPYVDALMTAAAKHVVAEFTRLGQGSNVSLLFVIPIWDNEGLEAINESKPDDANKYEKYMTREIIESSQFVRAKKTLHKNHHSYYSWYGNKYVAYSHTYLYVLSTEDTPSIDLDALVARWDAIVALGPPTSLTSYTAIDTQSSVHDDSVMTGAYDTLKDNIIMRPHSDLDVSAEEYIDPGMYDTQS